MKRTPRTGKFPSCPNIMLPEARHGGLLGESNGVLHPCCWGQLQQRLHVLWTAQAPLCAWELDDNDGRINLPNRTSCVESYSRSRPPCSCRERFISAFPSQLPRINPNGIVIYDHIVTRASGNALSQGKNSGSSNTKNSVE